MTDPELEARAEAYAADRFTAFRKEREECQDAGVPLSGWGVRSMHQAGYLAGALAERERLVPLIDHDTCAIRDGERIRLAEENARLRAALEAIDRMAHPHDKVRAIARDALGDAK